MTKHVSYILGLTGSIGSGKSTTAEMFRKADVPVWDADAVVHELYRNDKALIDDIAALAPHAIVAGSVDRDRLKAIIRAQPEVLSRIEAVVHPRVAAHRNAFIGKATEPLIVLDIPLLFEVGAEALCDGVLVVSTTPEEQRRRVLERGTMTQETFDLILSRQIPLSDKTARADFVIETKTLEQTRKEVQDLIEQLSGRDIQDA